MAIRIWPTENDVHDVSGGGKKPTEANLTAFRNSAAAQYSFYRDSGFGDEQVSAGGVLSGFDFSSGDATSVILTAGTATIEGYFIEDTATISGTLVVSSFNYVFLTIEKTAALVDALSLTVVDVATFDDAVVPPADPSILLWCFETDGASIITQYDFRSPGTNVLHGSYIGDGAATRTIDLGFRPKLVHVYRNEDERMIAQSPLAIPHDSGTQRGIFLGEPGDDFPMVAHMTSDPELVPILVEDGFTIEDGPGTIPGPVYIQGSKAYTPGNISGDSFDSTTIAVTGAKIGDLSVGQHTAVLSTKLCVVDCQVLSADVVTARFLNVSGSTVNIPAGTIKVGVFATDIVRPSLNELNKYYFFNAWF